MNILKKDLVRDIAGATGIGRDTVSTVIDGLIELIKTETGEGHTVKIAGFGTFSVKERPERQGRNPQTGAAVTIAASRKLQFKPAKTAAA